MGLTRSHSRETRSKFEFEMAAQNGDPVGLLQRGKNLKKCLSNSTTRKREQEIWGGSGLWTMTSRTVRSFWPEFATFGHGERPKVNCSLFPSFWEGNFITECLQIITEYFPNNSRVFPKARVSSLAASGEMENSICHHVSFLLDGSLWF